jgi:cytochrome c oxidase assembly protein subunit 15
MATQGLVHQPAIAEAAPAASPTWVASIPEARRRHLRVWLWTGAALTASTLVIGGITRLTESGLSIVDWAPIVGSVPPLNDRDWQGAFARYQQYPEYAKLRPDMTLSEFKYIYFWEYLHRMMGRLIGMVFLVPFIWFWLRGYLNGPLIRRLLVLFALGGLQGLMGWYMVKSGLVDRPEVSHYRLAAHLLLAVTIFGCCVWFANDLLARPGRSMTPESRRFMRRSLAALGALLLVQIFWGALVAGLKAGFVYGTFPLMDGSLLPPNGWWKDPWPINLVENMATVQWMHRVLATALLVGVIAFLIKVRRNAGLAQLHRWSAALAGLIVVQYGLGITTLLTHVKTPIAVTHQVTALLIVGVLLTLLHHVLGSGRGSRTRQIRTGTI